MSMSDFVPNDIDGVNFTVVNEFVKSGALPDAATVERLANEYLRQSEALGASEFGVALPQFPGSITSIPAGIPATPYNALPTDFAHLPGIGNLPVTLSEAELSGIASSVAQHAPSLPGAPISPTVPSISESALVGLPNASSFSFLETIRPLVSLSKSPSIPGFQALKIPTQSDVGAVESLLSDFALPDTIAPTAELAAKPIPGSVSQSVVPDPALLYSFVRDTRTLSSFDGVPAVESLDAVAYSESVPDFSAGPYDVNAVRRDFPILEERINGRQLVWLDNAATTQKPRAVIDRISYFYLHENSNIHRAAHTLAARATDAYEGARTKTAGFLNASSAKDIIFVRGATEGINLIAQAWGRKNIQKDDEIVITWLEHHANIVPWQMLCAEKGAKLRVAPVDNSGQVLLDEYEKLLGPKTKLVSISQVSNALGTITPITEMVAAAHRYGAKAVVDGAQAVSHMPIDVQAYGCDFYVFSGHKVFAPTGIGVVYGTPEVLEHMPPWQGGGNMIVDVTFEKTVYHGPPGRFEAGTGSIAPAVGLGAAIDYLNTLGMHNIARYEHDLLVYATEALNSIPGLHLIGTAKEKASVLSFVLDGYRTEDVGSALSQEGIAVRSGHHCAQPILRRFGLESTVRPSLGLYNTCAEIDKLVAAIWNLKQGRSATVV